MKKLVFLLVVVSLLGAFALPATAADNPKPDYSKPTRENLVHGYGTVFYLYGFYIEYWTAYYDQKEHRLLSEDKIRRCAKSIGIKIDVDPSTVQSKLDATKAELKYMDAGEKRAEELGYPYLMSCYSLGLAAGVVTDFYAKYGVYNVGDLTIGSEKSKTALHFLDLVKKHAKEVKANAGLMKRLDDMTAKTKKASTKDEFMDLGAALIQWHMDMYRFLESTSFIPPEKKE